MRTLLLICALVALSGCAGMANLVPLQAKTQLAKGVNKYCAEVDPMTRAVFRVEVNSLIAPNSIKVTCAVDTPAQ